MFRVERDGAELPPLTIVPSLELDRNPIETLRRGILGVSATYAPALVAPVRPGAAGALEPFDLVVAAGGRPVRHVGDLERAVAAAACAPLDLEVIRERPVALPGATLATPSAEKLAAVPTCDAERRRPFPRRRPLDLHRGGRARQPGRPRGAPPRRRDRVRERQAGAVVPRHQRALRRVPPAVAGRAGGREPAEVRLALADGRTVSLVPATERFVDEITREEKSRFVLGFHPDRRGIVDAAALVVEKVPLVRSGPEMLAFAWEQLSTRRAADLQGILKLFTGQISFKTVGGPLMLFSIATEAAEEGLSSFLFQMALISVNLGLMNLLPIPVLDGGNIAQALLEAVTRRPLSARARTVAQGIGLALLVTLMLFVFKNDIVRLMG